MQIHVHYRSTLVSAPFRSRQSSQLLLGHIVPSCCMSAPLTVGIGPLLIEANCLVEIRDGELIFATSVKCVPALHVCIYFSWVQTNRLVEIRHSARIVTFCNVSFSALSEGKNILGFHPKRLIEIAQ